jgi:hypothetical protein
MDERPRLAASEIEEELLRELQKLPTLHDTQSVRIRPYSGPKSKRFTWELDSIEPEVGPEQSKFADVTDVVAQLQPANDARKHARKRRPHGDRIVRFLRPCGRRLCRLHARNRHRPPGRPLPPMQPVRLQDDQHQPGLANSLPSGVELSPILGDGLKDRAAAVWD